MSARENRNPPGRGRIIARTGIGQADACVISPADGVSPPRVRAEQSSILWAPPVTQASMPSALSMQTSSRLVMCATPVPNPDP